MSTDHNRRRTLYDWITGAFATTIVFLWTGRSSGTPKTVQLDELPSPVKTARDRIFPKAKWYTAVKIEEENKIAFEIDGTTEKDADVTLLITDKGHVVEVETKMKSLDDVPTKAMTVVKDRWPKFVLTEAYEIHQGENLKNATDGTLIYDLRGQIVKGRDITVQVSAEGEILESVVEIPKDKVPKEVLNALIMAHPKYKISVVYAIREKDTIIGYQFEGKGAKGHDKSISVSADGKTVEELD